MITLTATLAVPVKRSGHCLAHHSHLVNGRHIVPVIMLIIPEAKTSQNLKIIQGMNELS